MKYVKTNMGEIYPTIEGRTTEDFNRIYENIGLGTRVLAIGDSIKELCDELVIHNPSNDGYFYPKYFVYKNKWENMLKPMSDYQKSKGIEIFGAIWVKGKYNEPILKSVAKLNDKGELCLI